MAVTETTTTASYMEQTGRWLPYDHDNLRQWLNCMVIEVDSGAKDLAPPVQALQKLIESDSKIFMLASSMFEQVPQEIPFNKDPLGRPQLRSYHHMLQVLNHVMTSAPKWDDAVYQIGWVGFPINVVLNWPMSTPNGNAFFLDERVNACLKRILKTWAEYLGSSASTNVLSIENGWLRPTAMRALMNEATVEGAEPSKFDEVFVCNPSLPYYGFTSWDDFFTRRFCSGARPVASPDNVVQILSGSNTDSRSVIVNACESRPYRLATNVARRDRFWLKDQPYSLVDMLANDELADYFVGGTVYQAFLSGLSYHRWHSPVSGMVRKAYLQPGTYYSKAASQGFGSIHTSLSPSQGYLAEIATRGIIFIEADNPDIGLVCFMPIGMAEVSTCEITVSVGQRVTKGEELGTFHYGGSTYCLIFGPHVEMDWVPDTWNRELKDGKLPEKRRMIPVNSRIATVTQRKKGSRS